MTLKISVGDMASMRVVKPDGLRHVSCLGPWVICI